MEKRSCHLPLAVSCIACHYLVFKDKDEAFFEICPVCGWQNDGTKEGEYSGCNYSTLADYRQAEQFEQRCLQGATFYMKTPY
ncbi:CPCC family cysteine-rich protein [Proteus hauseri]|uniref:CPCC family cysteine-rich protein n=1 Tax=Proteus hauseri TaxID=183417 RepID=UPI0032DAE0FB